MTAWPATCLYVNSAPTAWATAATSTPPVSVATACMGTAPSPAVTAVKAIEAVTRPRAKVFSVNPKLRVDMAKLLKSQGLACIHVL